MSKSEREGFSFSDQSGADLDTGEQLFDQFEESEVWICWEYETVGDKEKKPPIDSETGRKIDAGDSDNWITLETAIEAYKNGIGDGIGFVLSELPITVLDVDDCRDPESGELSDLAVELLNRFDSYAEVSPSGEGIHILVIGEKPEGYRNTSELEVYDSGQYITFTGKHIDETPERINKKQDELEAVCTEYLPEKSTTDGSISNGGNGIPVPTSAELEGRLSIKLGKDAIQALREESEITFEVLVSFLKGGIGREKTGMIKANTAKGKKITERDMEGYEHVDASSLFSPDGSIDRDTQETIALSYLKQTIQRHHTEFDPAMIDAITLDTFAYYCHKNPRMEGREKRQWLTEDDHYRSLIWNRYVENTTDREQFDLMVQYKKKRWMYDGDYSDLTYQSVIKAIEQLTPSYDGSMEIARRDDSSIPPQQSKGTDPRTEGERQGEGHYCALEEVYAEKSEAIELAMEIDDHYNERSSYETAFQRACSERGAVNHAQIGRYTHVYYPNHYPDPQDASYVKCNGEKRDPKLVEPKITVDASETSGPAVADGGNLDSEDDESDEDGNPGYPEGEPVSEEEQLLYELEDAPPHAAKRRIRERA